MLPSAFSFMYKLKSVCETAILWAMYEIVDNATKYNKISSKMSLLVGGRETYLIL